MGSCNPHASTQAFQYSIDDLAERYKDKHIDAIAGVLTCSWLRARSYSERYSLPHSCAYRNREQSVAGRTEVVLRTQASRRGASSGGHPLRWRCSAPSYRCASPASCQASLAYAVRVAFAAKHGQVPSEPCSCSPCTLSAKLSKPAKQAMLCCQHALLARLNNMPASLAFAASEHHAPSAVSCQTACCMLSVRPCKLDTALRAATQLTPKTRADA